MKVTEEHCRWTEERGGVPRCSAAIEKREFAKGQIGGGAIARWSAERSSGIPTRDRSHKVAVNSVSIHLVNGWSVAEVPMDIGGFPGINGFERLVSGMGIS
ncbi:hypothetical protein N836_20395 [Leptolyngbya sp. Heron Island J]|nr:hypothetical protein N836_20395 [Leptolyngbya sp. Heron Island J]